jgi:hypothetical protein
MEITRATEATIVALGPGQAASVGDVLAASHGNYPSFSFLFPDPTRRDGILRSAFTAVARDALSLGGVYGAVAGDGLLGVAVWLPPGRFPWSPGRKLRGTPAFLSGADLGCPAATVPRGSHQKPTGGRCGRVEEDAGLPRGPGWGRKVNAAATPLTPPAGGGRCRRACRDAGPLRISSWQRPPNTHRIGRGGNAGPSTGPTPARPRPGPMTIFD